MIEIPHFATKESEIEWVLKNREMISISKKNALKKGDFTFNINASKKQSSEKAEGEISDILSLELVINTTNLIDSHSDCHIPGIWNKSLKEIQTLFLLQEHEMDFDKIIADSINDGLKAEVRTISWKDLGQKFEGNTQALIFKANISRDRNEFMFKQYMKGYVLNHSVGMRYVKLYLCINSESASYAAEKDAWDKYYPMVANKEVADQKGYFWAVTEAKVIEGSAVVKGSNHVTPVLQSNKNIEPPTGTQQPEPPTGTQKKTTHLFI